MTHTTTPPASGAAQMREMAAQRMRQWPFDLPNAELAIRALPLPAEPHAEQSRKSMSDLVERLWQNLLDKDDRNSPEEYPDMAMLTFDEFAGYIREASAPHAEQIAALMEAAGAFRDALEESLALNINWSSDAEPETLAYYSEYKAVIKQAEAALARIDATKGGEGEG